MKISRDYSLLHHNTFHIEVKTKCFVEYDSEKELCDFLLSNSQKPFLHIGKGSNLLFTKDYDGTVLHSNIKFIDVVKNLDIPSNKVLLRVGSGVVWDDFVDYCVDNCYYGLENLSLIPGEVGAAAVQNIGAYGSEVKDFIYKVETINLETGKQKIFFVDECEYSYRKSIFKGLFKGQYAVTAVWFMLDKTFNPTISYGAISKTLAERGITKITSNTLRNVIIDIRRSKLPDPKDWGNAGSFFINPVIDKEQFSKIQQKYPSIPFYEVENGIKVPAGWLIEQCGWKGRSLGKAAVYEKQALVLINKGGATSKDIMNLSDAICTDVKKTFGITINPEVNWI